MVTRSIGGIYPFSIAMLPGLGCPIKLNAVEPADGDGQDELEEVEDGEEDVPLRQVADAHSD